MNERMTFQYALTKMRDEKRKLQRKGWNGKNMYVFYQHGYPTGIPINKNTAEAIGEPEGTLRCFAPYLMMKTADDTFVPWTISQTDVLAEDWQIVP